MIFEQFFSPDGPSIFWVHNSPSDLAESRYLRQSPWSGVPVVKRGQIIPDDQKIKGDSGEKMAWKSRNIRWVDDRGCGCIRTVDSEPECAQS